MFLTKRYCFTWNIDKVIQNLIRNLQLTDAKSSSGRLHLFFMSVRAESRIRQNEIRHRNLPRTGWIKFSM